MENRIIHWNIDPVIYWITESFPIKYYGLLFVTGILLAHYVVKQIYIKERLPIKSLEKLFLYVIVGVIVGARLGHCVFYEPAYYFQNPIEIILPIKHFGDGFKFIGFQGLASHGGGLGALLAIAIYCKKYGAKYLWVLDKIAIATPIVAIFIRFGNFMNSEIYGKPTNGNWGIVFQRVDLLPRHPSQLYELLAYLIILGVLAAIYKIRGKNKPNGLIFGWLLVLVFFTRFILEFFKENQADFEIGVGLNMGQLLSIPFIIVGLGLIITRKMQVY